MAFNVFVKEKWMFVTYSLLLGLSLLLDETLHVRLDHVLDLAVGQCTFTSLGESLLDGAGQGLDLSVNSCLRLSASSSGDSLSAVLLSNSEE